MNHHWWCLLFKDQETKVEQELNYWPVRINSKGTCVNYISITIFSSTHLNFKETIQEHISDWSFVFTVFSHFGVDTIIRVSSVEFTQNGLISSVINLFDYLSNVMT